MGVALEVRNTNRSRGVPIWSLVGRIACVGSTSAGELCHHANLNPFQIIKPSMASWMDFENTSTDQKQLDYKQQTT
mgnify:CR=1 FL=1